MVLNLLKNKKPDIRYLYDMKEVIFDKEWLKNAPNFELYYMYRGLKEKNGLRYDITIIPPKLLGKEFVKTKGHEHIGNYGEIYIVLKGEAIYLMQKRKKSIIEDVYYVKAKKGNVVIIPPGYGHITINPSLNEELKMANWVFSNLKSDYTPFLNFNGGCYFYTKNGWIKNKKYAKVPKLHFKKSLSSMPALESISFLK